MIRGGGAARWFQRHPQALIEMLSVLVVVALGIAFARPQLEGWGVLSLLTQIGVVTGYEAQFSTNPIRLLEPAPLALAYLTALPPGLGVGVVYGLLVAGKYAAGRWAASYRLRAGDLWIFGLLAAVMPPWASEWRAHNMAQQASALCLILAFGAALRLTEKPRPLLFAAPVALIPAALCFYEGLILCVPALLAFTAIACFRRVRHRPRALVAPALAVLAGLAVYGLYFVQASRLVERTYQSGVMSSDSPLTQPMTLLGALYSTAYRERPLGSAAALLVLLILAGVGTEALGKAAALRRFAIVTAGFLCLPALSLVYGVNAYFLADIERVGFPVGMGLFCLALAIATTAPLQWTARIDLRQCWLAAVVLVLYAAVNAYQCYLPYRIQATLIRQLLARPALMSDPRTIVLRDRTGLVGDEYVFADSGTLAAALRVYGASPKVTLCVADDVERDYPRSREVGFGIMVPQCGELPPSLSERVLLDVVPASPDRTGLPTVIDAGIEPATDRGRFPSEVASGSVTPPVDHFQWLTSPKGTIAVTNATTAPAALTWTATFEQAPCPEPDTIVVRVGDRAFPVAVNGSTPFSLDLDLQAGERREIEVETTSKVCRTGDPRPFYVGVRDPVARLR